MDELAPQRATERGASTVSRPEPNATGSSAIHRLVSPEERTQSASDNEVAPRISRLVSPIPRTQKLVETEYDFNTVKGVE